MVVVTTVAQRREVASACALAARAGVKPGMSLAHARSLVPGVTDGPHDPARDDRSLHALARWALRWSPMVAADRPSGLLLDITGCEHLFGGEEALASGLAQAMRGLGLSCRVGVASNVGTAWAVARYAEPHISCIAPGDELRELSPLPVDALRLEPGVGEALREIGVETVGQLLALPREGLAKRFGVAILRRIDQALGRSVETVAYARQEPGFRVTLEMPGGTTQWEAVALATKESLERLSGRLERRGLGMRRLEALYRCQGAPDHTLTVRVSVPTCSAARLWPLLRPKLERLQLGFGVERIALTAGEVGTLIERQGEIGALGCEASGGDGAFGALLDVIANRIDRKHVRVAQLRASHRPERSFAFCELGEREPGSELALPEYVVPSQLFEPPERVRVMALVPDGPPMKLWWRGAELELLSSAGPERLAGEWWLAREPARNYYRVQTAEGEWLWLFREGESGDWFVHGRWA